MDPNSLAGLDPKLRETYERVMGTTTTPQPSDTAQASTASPPDTSQPTFSSTPFSTAPSQENPQTTPAQPVSGDQYAQQTSNNTSVFPAAAAQQTVPAFQPLPSPASVAQASEAKQPSLVIRILYLTGGVIFFLLYTIFWTKVFGLSLPF